MYHWLCPSEVTLVSVSTMFKSSARMRMGVPCHCVVCHKHSRYRVHKSADVLRLCSLDAPIFRSERGKRWCRAPLLWAEP